MPRPGPRPYACERRAWHSDRHQPIRGSLIQEIFRVVNEIHSSATKKNKEWQEKLPVVVLKAEEIMYSKANSEAEYMDIKTLWDRTNDAINTIIRRDESTETEQFLQPCIEAALNLGCTARRTLRSQRNCSPRFYLNPGTQEEENTTQGNLLTKSHFMANCSSFIKHTTVNVTHMSSEAQTHIPRNVEKQSPSLYSDYPLLHENHLKVEELPHECAKSISNTVESAKMSGIHNIFSPHVDFSNNMNQTDVRNTCNNPHEIAWDLSLRLGPLSTPCSSGGNNSTFLEWNEIGHLTPPAEKNLSSFPRSSRDAPLSSSSNEWSVEGGHMDVNATSSKRRTVYCPPLDQQFSSPPELPCSDLTVRTKRVGS